GGGADDFELGICQSVVNDLLPAAGLGHMLGKSPLRIGAFEDQRVGGPEQGALNGHESAPRRGARIEMKRTAVGRIDSGGPPRAETRDAGAETALGAVTVKDIDIQ